MRTLVSLYLGIKAHSYREQDGTVREDHTASLQDVVWLGISIIFGIFIVGGLTL